MFLQLDTVSAAAVLIQVSHLASTTFWAMNSALTTGVSSFGVVSDPLLEWNLIPSLSHRASR